MEHNIRLSKPPLNLPREIWLHITTYLDEFDKILFRRVNLYFSKLISTTDKEAKLALSRQTIFCFNYGDLKWLKWAFEHQFIKHRRGIISEISWSGTIFSSLLLLSYDLGKKGHIDLIEWLHAYHPYYIDLNKVCNGACAGGHLKIVQWCWAKGASPGYYDVEMAKQKGHNHIVKWLTRR